MTILIAPDKFKGSLTAKQVCDAIQEALLEHDPTLNIMCVPLADGGEGTGALLTASSGGKQITVQAHDPLFRRITTAYGISQEGTVAFIEMASASGFQLLKDHERNPMLTSSYGTGELIRDALDRGVKKIILGIGGTATNDGGIGMAAALGVRFLSRDQTLLQGTGGDLLHVHRIDLANVHPLLGNADVTILCDVDNPLYGEHGAAAIFAPQKGATPEMVAVLDKGLRHLADTLEQAFCQSIDFPGAGAGGGLPAMLRVLSSVTIVPGMEFISVFTNLDNKVRHADVVITGEGKVDRQTLSGKVVSGVAELCRRYQKPMFVVAGQRSLSQEEEVGLGIHRITTLANDEVSGEAAIQNAYALIKKRVKDDLIPFFL